MSAVIRRHRLPAPRRRRRDNGTRRRPGREIPREERQQDDREVAPRASDAEDNRREALDWLADNLVWKRTLDALRAKRPR
jgi:hypothetical protein